MADGGARPEGLAAGVLAHSCAGRSRIEFAALKGCTETLETLRQGVLQISGVLDAQARPITGSLIVSHWGPSDYLLDEARRAGLFALAPDDGVEMPKIRASNLIRDLESRFAQGVGCGMSVRSIAALAFAAMGVMQIARGVIAPPAATALWSAAILLFAENGNGAADASEGPAAD
jgi:hypothetical protein